MSLSRKSGSCRRVALLAEGVGRNNVSHLQVLTPSNVALLAEGVGRNSLETSAEVLTRRVALLAEGVGRNSLCAGGFSGPLGRPPRGGRG